MITRTALILLLSSSIGSPASTAPEPGLAPRPPATAARLRAETVEVLPDTGRAAPDTVLIAADAGDLRARWTWAERTARDRRLTAWWLAWTVPGDTTGTVWYNMDRHVPPPRPANASLPYVASTIYGSWSFGSFSGGITFSGVPLAPMVGARNLHDITLLVRYEVQDGRAVPVRVHIGSFAFPVHFDGGALLWLGGATPAESVERTRSLFSTLSEDAMRQAAVAMTGIAHDPGTLPPALRAWLDDHSLDAGVRREAAQWLGTFQQPDAVAALSRAAQEDTSFAVRTTAVRAFGRAAAPGPAVDLLDRLARQDKDSRIRREAVQTLGIVGDERAFRALVDLVQRPGGDTAQAAVRGQAMLTLVAQQRGLPAPRATIDLLARIARTDPDTTVELRAVDALNSIRDDRILSILTSLVDTHPSLRVQQRAIQGLVRTEPPEAAARELRRIAWDHPRPEVQRSAVRFLVQVKADTVRDLLSELAEKHPRPEIRRAALDALIQLKFQPPDAGRGR